MTVLEKDLSDWLLCHYCTLFHPVAQDDGPEKGWRYFDEPECVRASGVVYITMGSKIRYPWEEGVPLPGGREMGTGLIFERM